MAKRAVRIQRGANDGVLIGHGAVASDLASTLQRLGAERVALMTTPSVERSSLLPAVTAALGEHHSVTYAGSMAHTPREAVIGGVEAARSVDADAVVSLGGSSVVDMTKGVAMVLAEGDDFDALTIESGNRLRAPMMAHVAIPTTLSAAEFTSAAGITNSATGVKELFASAAMAPRWVILDPEMTTATPDRLWVGTGMKLVADCLEGLLSARATAYSRALLQAALRILLDDLGAPRTDLAARGRCLEAAHMTLSNLHNVGIGAVAALRHQLGGGCGVPHGEASTIVLPHVMRWNGEVAQPNLDRVAADLGLGSADQLIDYLADRIGELGLPTRLRDVGVAEEQLDAIAEHAGAEPSARANVRPADAEGLRSILAAAY